MKKEEPSQEIPQFSKEYMSDKEVKRREFEVKGLLNKKSDTQATSLEAVQRSKPKPKIKRSISMLPRKRAPRGLRRQSDVVVPTIRIDDYFVSKPDAATDKLQNNGHTSKRKPSFGFLDILMPLHSPKFTKHRGHKKSKSSDVLESELSESGASDINLLDTDTFLEKKFKETAGKELRKFYSYFSVPLPSPWMKKQIKISDIFVEPILSFNRKAVPLEKLFVVQPNRSTKNPLIVIKGQPGAGKTALCQYLVHSWCQNEARVVELDSIELLFMIECKFVTPNLMSSLRTIYLKESISLLPRAEADNEYLFKVINKFKTLIILDGFDEIQDSSRSLLEKIRTELPDAKVIVSTRLSGIRDIQETLELDISYDAVEFLLQLFDDDQLVSLVLNISHIYDISDEDQIKLLDHVDDNDELRQVLQVPLHLILYLMLWIHEPIIFKNMKTVIDVFDGVISLMCNQLCTCIEMKSGQPLLTLQVVKSLLNEVGHLCLQCIQGRQFYFTPREYHSLKHYCDTVGINLHNALKIMMHEVTYLSGRNLKTFCHVTVMEHLAATFMDDNIITNVTGIFEILTPNKGANSGPVNCWKSCASITSTPTATVTNSGTRNYQLDSAISHLAQISCKNDHHTFKMGKELATYFSLNNNRNLITLSNIISPLQTREHPFKHGLKKGLSNQNLPDQIHIWNLKHVINLIEYGALKPSVQVKFTVENSKEWGTIVNKLVNLGCKPYINVVLEDVDQMKALVCALGVIKNPSVPKLILHFGFVEIGINDLVASWPYPKTMHMVSPKGKYAIESYLACILLVEAMGKNRVKYIKFTGHESSYIFGLLKTSLSGVEGFYVPGVAPVEFKKGNAVEVNAVKMTSSQTQLPYRYYSLHFCHPKDGPVYKAENLGEILRGDRIVSTPYAVFMNVNSPCKFVCNNSQAPMIWNQDESRDAIDMIKHDYYVHLIMDNLPIATKFDHLETGEPVYERGYKLGMVKGEDVYINNHLDFILSYHSEPDSDVYKLVRFEVEPRSIALSNMKSTADGCSIPETFLPQKLDPSGPNSLVFSYSVVWKASDVHWSSRWNIYLNMTDLQIHWFSIINSLVVVFFLSGILTMIMVRTLRRDIAR
ncbi:Nonaspanin (TM9SF) [Trinorchestia longiramus]|nr:Nonaspanin (TM9SF) [Trinorchestia longiramus]